MFPKQTFLSVQRGGRGEAGAPQQPVRPAPPSTQLDGFTADKYKWAWQSSDYVSSVNVHCRPRRAMTVEDSKLEDYLTSMSSNPHTAWLRPISRSATLFSNDGCRKAILDSLNMAWTRDRYKDVEIKYSNKEK